MPGQANTVSVITDPDSRMAKSSAQMVTSGMRALRRAWWRITRRSGTPLARAVRVYSELITSSIDARPNRLSPATLDQHQGDDREGQRP